MVGSSVFPSEIDASLRDKSAANFSTASNEVHRNFAVQAFPPRIRKPETPYPNYRDGFSTENSLPRDIGIDLVPASECRDHRKDVVAGQEHSFTLHELKKRTGMNRKRSSIIETGMIRLRSPIIETDFHSKEQTPDPPLVDEGNFDSFSICSKNTGLGITHSDRHSDSVATGISLNYSALFP